MNKPVFKRVKHTLKGIDDFQDYRLFKEKIDGNISREENISSSYIDKYYDKILGIDKYFYNEIKELNNISNKYTIKGKNNNLILEYDFNIENNQLVNNKYIELEKDSEATITILVKSNVEFYNNSFLTIDAKENSKIKVIYINLSKHLGENILTVIANIYKNSHIDYYEANFGSFLNSVSLRVNLLEDESTANIIPTYFCDEDKKMDLEYTLKFYGKRCNGIIDARGVTKDISRKIFRGNLIFEKGSTKSEGSEGEFSIILSKECNAQSIPTLFCEEDDVIGAHSANIGKINQDKLYYLMSRGLTEKEAKKMVILSSIGPVIEQIENEEIKNEILKELDDRI